MRLEGLVAQFGRFVVVGIAATATHVAIALICIELAGLGVQAGTFVAFSCALSVSYGFNRSWTYRAKGLHRQQFPRFAAVSLTGYAVNASTMALVSEVLGWSYLYGLAVVVVIIPVISFTLHRYWTFNRTQASDSPSLKRARR